MNDHIGDALRDASGLVVRTALTADVDDIARFHERENGRPCDRDALMTCLPLYPSAVALRHGVLVGFGYCGRFAPDILEVRNLLVAAEGRSAGLGSLLLAHMEREALGRWAAAALSNSDAYPTAGKRPATEFYLRNGYERVWDTGVTRVFIKALVAADG